MKKIILSVLLVMAGTVLSYAQYSNFKWLRNVSQQTVRTYSDGLSAFYENGKWGFVGRGGNVEIEPAFDEVGDFSEGLCVVKVGDKYGVIDKKGNYIHPCSFVSITSFDGNVAFGEKDGMRYYVYSDGKVQPLTGSKFEYHPYSDGYAKVRNVKSGKWGYADKKGVVRIDIKYDEASDFQNGHAVAKQNGKWYILNKMGDKKGTSISFDGTYMLFPGGAGYIKKGDAYFFLSSNFHMSNVPYQEVHPTHDGLIRVKDGNGNYSYLNTSGENVILASNYDACGDFSENKAWVRKNGKYGYINTRGALVIDTVFSYAEDFHNDVAYVAVGQRQGVIVLSSEADPRPVMEISGISVADNSGNSVVEVEENFEITFTVKNSGGEALKSAYVSLSGDAVQSAWFNYDHIRVEVGNLNPGESKVCTFKGVSNTSLVSDNISLTLKGEADNLFQGVVAPCSFNSSGISACKPVLETFWAYTPDHSPLAPGVEATLELSVKNEGTDMAKDVTITLSWPEGVEFKETILTIPQILAGETEKISTTFKVKDGNGELAAKEFSMVAYIDEFTHKRNDVRYISFATGRRNVLTSTTSGMMAAGQYADAGVQVPKEVKKESELVIGLTKRKETSRSRFALVIGNEDYNSMKQEATYQPNVDFAVQDAEAFAKYANNVMGVPENNIILIKNATLAQMKSNLDKIEKLAQNDIADLELIVYYAGHGQVDGDTKESYLIPVDVSITAPKSGIKLADFYSTLSSCNAKKTMVFLDACYSGVGRGIIIRPKETPVKGNLIVMTATSSTQRSMPYHEKNHGLFTYFLLKTMRDSSGDMTIGELFDEVQATVKTNSVWINNSQQTPELINGPDIVEGWKNWTL